MTASDQTIDPVAPLAEPDARRNGDGLSKLAGISEALRSQKVSELGKEYRLFVHLLAVANGVMSGTKEMIGAGLHTNGRNVSNWAASLEAAGIATVTHLEHRQIEIRLKEPWYSIASKEERPIPKGQEQVVPVDPDLQNLMTIYETAKATGQELEIKTIKKIPTNGKPAQN